MTTNEGLVEQVLIERVLAEYAEMPGLSLTPEQAVRLWGLSHERCVRVLQVLVDQGRLRRTPQGRYVAAQGGP